MSRIHQSLGYKAKMAYFVLLLLAVASLALSGIDFLNIGGHAVLLPHRLFIAFLVLYFISVLFISRQISLNRLDIAVLSFLGVMLARFLLEIIQPYPLEGSITILVQLLFVIALYFAIGSYPVNRREIRILFRIWLITVFIVSLYGFYQIFARNMGLPMADLSFGAFHTVEANLWGFQRPTSIFTEPTHYSAFVLPAYVMISVLYIKGYAKSVLFSMNQWNIFILIFFWINYFFIASLGGFIAVAATISVGAVFQANFRRIAIPLGIVSSFSIFTILTFGQGIDLLYAPAYRIIKFITSVIGVFIGDGQVSGSIGVRMTRLYWALQVWIRQPVFGIGINNIIHLSGLTLPDWYFGRSISPVTHSIFGLLLSSAGLVGTIAYSWIYISGYRCLRSAKESFDDPIFQSLVVAVGYAVLVNFFNGFFSIPLVSPQSWFLFGIVSMLVCYERRCSDKD